MDYSFLVGVYFCDDSIGEKMGFFLFVLRFGKFWDIFFIIEVDLFVRFMLVFCVGRIDLY